MNYFVNLIRDHGPWLPRKKKKMNKISAQDWDSRYLENNAPWDLSGPTPEFLRLIETKIIGHKGRAIVPGAGRSYDAISLAKSGMEVDVVDFAPTALRDAQERALQEKAVVYFYKQDAFDLMKLPYFKERYDLWLEYTFYCAIDPSMRDEYVKLAHYVLKPGATLVGLFFPTSIDKEGPPFQVSQEEVEKKFSPYFDVTFEKPLQSVKPRAGREFLGIFRNR